MKKLLITLAVGMMLLPFQALSVTRSSLRTSISGGIKIDLADPAGSIYQPGESISLRFETSEDSYVIIFDIDTDGYVHLIYPESSLHIKKAYAGRKYEIPDNPNSSLLVSGSTGLEYIFAVSVTDRSRINDEELDFLAANENLPADELFHIDGDPMLAANMIASELVRGISHLDGVSMAFTDFFINDIVEYPRYICSECHEGGRRTYTESCAKYDWTEIKKQRSGLAYPLDRGFDAVLAADQQNDEDVHEDETSSKVYIAFYPYESSVYYPGFFYSYYSRPWYYSPLWYDPWWGYYDPFYGAGSGFSFNFGWSWGWNYYDYPYWGSGWGWGSSGWGYDRYYANNYYVYRPLHLQRHRRKSNLYAAAVYTSRKNPDLRINSVRYKHKQEMNRKSYVKDRTLKKKHINKSMRTGYKKSVKRRSIKKPGRLPGYHPKHKTEKRIYKGNKPKVDKKRSGKSKTRGGNIHKKKSSRSLHKPSKKARGSTRSIRKPSRAPSHRRTAAHRSSGKRSKGGKSRKR